MTIPRTKLRSRLTIVLCALLSLWSVVAGGFNASASATSPVSTSPNSIVQLGDSIASGEGTLYGFTFNSATGKWVGPANPNPTWAGPYQDCHQSADAYGHVLAATYPKASFTQLACTGATFDKGISGPWSAARAARVRQLGHPHRPQPPLHAPPIPIWCWSPWGPTT